MPCRFCLNEEMHADAKVCNKCQCLQWPLPIPLDRSLALAGVLLAVVGFLAAFIEVTRAKNASATATSAAAIAVSASDTARSAQSAAEGAKSSTKKLAQHLERSLFFLNEIVNPFLSSNEQIVHELNLALPVLRELAEKAELKDGEESFAGTQNLPGVFSALSQEAKELKQLRKDTNELLDELRLIRAVLSSMEQDVETP